MTASGPGSRVRIGVIGCADIARRRMLPAMVSRPEIELVAVASREPAKAKEFAELFGCAAVHGYDALLERSDLDAVYLPLPAGLHTEWIMRSLDAGLHVLCEKPLTTTHADAVATVRRARQRGLLLVESFMFLRHSQHAAVRRLVAEGAIGELRTFVADFGIPPLPPGDIRNDPALGGGALDVGVYPIRAAQFYLGSRIEVAGACLRADPALGVDVAGSALLYDEDGVMAQLGFGFAHAYRSAYELWGSEGRIVLDRAFTPPRTHQPVVRIERQNHREERILPPDDQFAAIAGEFARAILDGADFGPYGESILRQAALVDQVTRRARRL
jgi:dTDP-3,4-didehydro-2,6-dideoxy-alpha-D-glucose 3-reductase